MAIEMPASVDDLSTKGILHQLFFERLLASALCIDIFAILSPVMPEEEAVLCGVLGERQYCWARRTCLNTGLAKFQLDERGDCSPIFSLPKLGQHACRVQDDAHPRVPQGQRCQSGSCRRAN